MAAARSTGSGSATSNVGSRQIYEAKDQRTESRAEVNDRERYKEGQQGSHLANDSSGSCIEDERSIANRLGREEQRTRKDEVPVNPQAELSKKDPTLPVCFFECTLKKVARRANRVDPQAKLHGNNPSKGAQIDAELKKEDEQRLREKSGK
ncbi:hypothetical protein UA08_07202 [Talaromyces atroroseus]|uniref:Uncharacterized protein n=1 Tax=Talaromyces atroroseus TaxID=1441469 RepID=A0A225AJW5_TALAT|nr:hypothetical protein UA08_07202 [Talaromyces atroroseus]OKL57478.1 hypothetical protein UA08_07202 [Talaromyces atroroseus]